MCHEQARDGDVLPVERGVTFGLAVFEKAQGDCLAECGRGESSWPGWGEWGVGVDHAVERYVGDPKHVESGAQECEAGQDVAFAVGQGFVAGHLGSVAQDAAVKGAEAEVCQGEAVGFDGFAGVGIADVLGGDIGFDVLDVVVRKPSR